MGHYTIVQPVFRKFIKHELSLTSFTVLIGTKYFQDGVSFHLSFTHVLNVMIVHTSTCPWMYTSCHTSNKWLPPVLGCTHLVIHLTLLSLRRHIIFWKYVNHTEPELYTSDPNK